MLNVRVVSHAVPEDEVLVEERVLSLIEQLIPDDLLVHLLVASRSKPGIL